MLKSDALRHFKNNGAEIARKLNIGRAAVCKWGEMVPPLQAAKLQKITRGKLRFNPDHYVAS